MKKLIAILLLALMIVSLAPSIFAEEDSTADDSTDDVEDAEHSRSIVEKMKERRENIKNKIIQARETIKQNREELSDARDAWKAAKASGNDAEALAKAKELMTLGIQKMIDQMNIVKERISSKENYPEQAKALNAIDAKIARLNEDLQKIEAATTMKDLRGIAGKAKGHYKEVSKNLKKHVGNLMNEKMKNAYNMLDRLANKIDTKIEELKADGKDVSEYETLLTDANAKIAEAKAIYAEAKTIFDSAESSNNEKEVFEQGKAKLKEATNSLRQAKDLLKQIVVKMKGENNENSDD